MGYSTDFTGKWKIEPALKPAHLAYLTEFAQIRHMQRDVKVTEKRPDPVREAVGLPVGVEGQYFVAGEGYNRTEAPGLDIWDSKNKFGVLNGNHQAHGVPGLWCGWTPNTDGTAIEWDGGEKFYAYVEWIQYLINHFLKPWGYKLTGRIDWQGEEEGDTGYIVIYNHQVYVNEDPVLEKIADAL